MVFVSFELDLAVTLPEGLMKQIYETCYLTQMLEKSTGISGMLYVLCNINNHAFGLALVSVLVSR